MNDSKEDIHNEGFNPKIASSPKDNDRVKENKMKEQFLACSKCSYKSIKEDLLKKHMLTKHENYTCKECKDNFQSLMELLKHVSKHHVNEKDEVNEIKDQGDIVGQNEKNQEMVEIDLDEVERIKRNKNKNKTYNEEKDNSFVFSESQFFNEFL